MAVYFVYRSHYHGPAGKHVRVLPGDTPLEWFQSVWDEARNAPDAERWVDDTLGTSVYGFHWLFEAANEQGIESPKSDADLKLCLQTQFPLEGEVLYAPHAIRVINDDDEIELAYFFFDDHERAAHPGRSAYLLHDDWRLPIGSGIDSFESSIPVKQACPPAGGGGRTYLVFLAAHDSSNLTSLDQPSEGPWVVEGVRVDGLATVLRAAEPRPDWPAELLLLRSCLGPTGAGPRAIEVALERCGQPPRGWLHLVGDDQDPSKSMVSASDHLLQLALHIGEWFGQTVYHQWVIFDDLWAGANRDLAEGLLDHATRWDPFTED